MSDDLTVGLFNFLSNEPLQVSLGGTPFNKAHLDARAAEIKRLETALKEARAEIERLRAVIDRVARVDNSLAKQLRASIENNASLVGELSTLRARVREVVGPFADAASDLDDTDKDSTDIWEAPCAMQVNVGHLRAASKLVEEVK